MRLTALAGIIAVGLMPGCKGKTPVEPVQQGPRMPSVDDALQLVMVTPSDIAAQTPTPAQIVGHGFQQGAEVQVGETWVSGVRVDSENLLTLTLPALPDGRYDLTVQNQDGGSRTLYAAIGVGTGGSFGGASVARACGAQVVYFELDSQGLSSDAVQALDGEVTCWRDDGRPVVIAGHADARGTTDYNLALGQRRALSVRSHLSKAGLPLHQMRTVSYGEERPAQQGGGETAWAANRRVEVTPE